MPLSLDQSQSWFEAHFFVPWNFFCYEASDVVRLRQRIRIWLIKLAQIFHPPAGWNGQGMR